MITYKEWLEAIKLDIYKKYNIKTPRIFFHDGDRSLVDEKTIFLWLKYKQFDGAFIVKPIAPDPEDVVSLQLIDDYLKTLGSAKKIFTIAAVGKEAGTGLYDECEIKKELRYLFRQGMSKITVSNKEIMNDITIFHLIIEQDTLQNMLNNNYLILEYSY